MQQTGDVALLFWPVVPGVRQKATGNAVFIIISIMAKNNAGFVQSSSKHTVFSFINL